MERLQVLLRSYCENKIEKMDIDEFSNFVGISVYNPYIYNLFTLMDRVSKKYLLIVNVD